MSLRGFLYCVLVALLICAAIAATVTGSAGLRKQGMLAGVSTEAEIALIFGGAVGLVLLLVPPVFGLVYRHDPAAFRELMQPRYGLHQPLRPVPALTQPVLRQLVRWLLGLGLAAEAVVRLLAYAGLLAGGWPPGLPGGFGAYVAACWWAGGSLYLHLRNTCR